MVKTNFVVAGAYYYNKKDDTVLKCHYTGNFTDVDCTLHENIKEDEVFEDNCPIKYDGEKYLSVGRTILESTQQMDLLSDLSNLLHQEESYDFK